MVGAARATTAAAMSCHVIMCGLAIADTIGEVCTSALALLMDTPTARATITTPATRTVMIPATRTDRLPLRSPAPRAPTIKTAIGSLIRTAQINSNTIPTSRNSTRDGSPGKIDTRDQVGQNAGLMADLRDFALRAAGPLEKERSLPMFSPDTVGSWRCAIE